MKLSVKLTMQGLIRALRGRALDLAEKVERDRDFKPGRSDVKPRKRGENGIRGD